MGASPQEKEQRPRKKPGRVPTSCQECRRLKLRCDRNVPCQKCVSRGCGSICPDGQLTPGKGNRMVLSNTEELHERIEHLCIRIRELEDALRTLQESVSGDPHPLLRTDLLLLKTPTSNPPASDGSSSSPSNSSLSTLASEELPDPRRSDDENLIDAFGTLSIGPNGESSFLGQTARAEYILRALAKLPPPPFVMPPRLSRRVVASAYPESDIFNEDLGREVFQMLPPLSEAIRLCDIYLEHGSYLSATLPRKELIDEVLDGVYRAGSFETMRCRQVLALLFVVFATAALLDPERHPHSIEAQEYYYLSRAALNLAPPVRETTLAAIHTLIHLAQYLDLSDTEGASSNAAWIYVGTAVRLAHGIGLHLNSSRWDLNEQASERRSRLFWQLFSADTFLSYNLGRPPSMTTAYIDCPYPKDLEQVTGPDGSKEISFSQWYTTKYSVLMHSVMSAAFGSKVPTYATILDLDRKVRDFQIPPHLQCVCVNEAPTSAARQMQRFFVLMAKESVLLSLHRAYFAQALQDKPDDLANHRFIPSVMAAYRSAWRMTRGMVIAWQQNQQYLSRVASAWSPCLSAAIVMCILVTRAPTSKMTKSALEELDAAAQLFQDAASKCRIAVKFLAPVLLLRRKAYEAVDDKEPPPDVCGFTPADLDRLGGKTHLVSETSSNHDSPAPPPARPSSLLFDVAGTNSETMHPTIAQDMRSFDLGEPSQFFDTFGDAGMAGIQFTGDHSIFVAPPPPAGYNGYGAPPAAAPSPGVGFGGPPPMLDATWQNFVEQLGF